MIFGFILNVIGQRRSPKLVTKRSAVIREHLALEVYDLDVAVRVAIEVLHHVVELVRLQAGRFEEEVLQRANVDILVDLLIRRLIVLLELADQADLLEPHGLLDLADADQGFRATDLLCLPVSEVSDEQLLEDAPSNLAGDVGRVLAPSEGVKEVYDGGALLGEQVEAHEVLDHAEQAVIG